jgi:hypothetical protein
MSFRDCMLSAVEQGEISRAEADDLMARFDDNFAQAQLSLGDDAARQAAKDVLAAELKYEAIELRRRVALQDQARARNIEYLQGYRDAKGRPDVFSAALNLLEHYGYAGTSSVVGRTKAITALAHGAMADVLSTFRRTRALGTRMNRPMVDDVVRGLFGEATTPEAGALADAIGGVFETMRQRFNAAGGAIAHLERWGLPQGHDAGAMLQAGRARWKDFVRPLLDPDRMRDPLTGGAMTQARLEQSLDHVFDTITTDGWSKRTPSMQAHGRGSLASQRADHRFLIFRDAESWLAYDREFGHGDPIRSVFEHVNGLSRDIATMEILGPNPGAMVEWMKQVVTTEAAKAIQGQPSLYQRGSKAAEGIAEKLNYLGYRIDAVYQYVRGRQVVSNALTTGFGDVRNVLTSAQLGSASIIAATTDPVLDAAARYLSGLPIAGAFSAVLRTGDRLSREEAVRSGLLLDDFVHIMQDEARFAGLLGGSEWSRWLADRTVTWSGLSPMTQARKHVFAREFEATLADNAGRPFDELPAALRRTMEGYGLDATDWDVMRQTELHRPRPDSAAFLRPIDVAALADAPALPRVQQLLGIDAADEAAARELTAAGARRVAEKYLEMILGQTERAVPEGTARARSFVSGAAPRGTFSGELLNSFLQYKSFGLSFTTLQLDAIGREIAVSRARGAAYAGGLAVSLTIAGALGLQLKQIVNGKDPQPMDDPRFWIQALQTGGGFGLMGDFLFADQNRLGQSAAEQVAGPTLAATSDALKLTVGNVQAVVQGKDPRLGRDVTNTAGRYTPVLSSLWPLRAAYRRVFLDQLQYLLDPEAARAFGEQQGRLRRDTRQEFFWEPGDLAPTRAPRLENALP